MKITSVDTLFCDAGWRPWTFIKIGTDEGVVGWSECTDSHGSPRGIAGVVSDLAPLLIGQDPRAGEKLYWDMYARTRQSPGGIVQKAIGGVENALLDIKARALGVSVYELFGGPLRERIPLYWSHCGTTRIRAWQTVCRGPIVSVDDVKRFGQEILASGYDVIKTNIGIMGDNPYVYMPGFLRSPGGPELNADRYVLRAVEDWVAALRAAVGNNVDIILDLNFNFKTEGYIKIGKILEQFGLLWLEIDSYDPEALLRIRNSINIPVCSGENLYGIRQYRPYLEKHAMDIVSIDIIWNGFSQSRKISDAAELYEMNITPHNYNGHLSTFISAQFCALIPNLRIMEIDVDDVPWREELFTHPPQVENGYLRIPTGPGWGTGVNEQVILEHPWPQ